MSIRNRARGNVTKTDIEAGGKKSANFRRSLINTLYLYYNKVLFLNFVAKNLKILGRHKGSHL